MKKKVILVTDGDDVAQAAIMEASRNLGLYPIMSSGGNPTPLTGPELVEEIQRAPYDPVVIMLDDHGKVGEGCGERALEHLLRDDSLDILGVVAVASDTEVNRGVRIRTAVDLQGDMVDRPVDKDGIPEPVGNRYLEGDTSEVLARYPRVKVVGCGDPGKMLGHDNPQSGAEITTRCLETLLKPADHDKTAKRRKAN